MDSTEHCVTCTVVFKIGLVIGKHHYDHILTGFHSLFYTWDVIAVIHELTIFSGITIENADA